MATTDIDSAPSSDVYQDPWNAIAAWFLGPRSENREIFNRLVLSSLNFYEDCRENYYPADPCYITEEVKASPGFRGEIKDLEEKLGELNQELTDSIPFYSTRYQGHMTSETTLPATLGYLAGMMWNQNNVDSSASPVTTQMEIKVGDHLCQLIQYPYTEEIRPWAHITSCGSVANIEALWSARNLKFHPLAIKACVMDSNADAKLKDGANMPVYVPELGKQIPLHECSQWQLLNLNVDTVCNLTSELKKYCQLESTALIDAALKKHSVVSIGLGNFMYKQELKNSPVFFCPGTCHYSYPKAATILGLGDQSVIPLEVDRNCRVNMGVLRQKLESHLELHIPVITVVAVIGSTEESAVDPILEMYKMREEFKKRGLNFTIHADAAWGGYMLTMLREPSVQRVCKLKNLGESYVPEIPLSDYAAEQYNSMKLADTVTIDPHKSGFCQYPAGALAYRNGVMKGFITLQAPEVFHSESDISVGVYGLEGSKPGAAATGVLLAHRVLGLDKTGFGRILGQCQLGAKLFYCMWMTVAQKFDDFVCLNFIDIPEGFKIPEGFESAESFIRARILGKDNRDLAKDKEAMNFLSQVGPDALINTFTVNPKGNTDTNLCNELQSIIFSELNGTVGKSSKRIPLFLTKSELEEEKYGAAFIQLKQRLGLNDNAKKIGFLRNTAMNPFQASEAYVTEISKLFRNCILNSIGGLKGSLGDAPAHHGFIVSGKMIENEGKVFLDYMPSFTNKSHQYNVVLTMKAANEEERVKFTCKTNKNVTYVCKTRDPITMMDLLRNSSKIAMDVYKIGTKSKHVCTVDLIVDEVFRYEHLEDPKSAGFIDYPAFQKYFLYGDKKRAFISHVITKHEDFHQVVELDEIPHSVPEAILDMGSIITIRDIRGNPLYLGDKISDPLQGDNYVVEFKGKQYIDCKTTIRFQKPTAKKYFDAEYLNGAK